MTTRVLNIVQKLSSQSEEAISQVLDELRPIVDLTADEKIDLSEALISIFYHYRHADSTSMLKLAIRTEKRLGKFGPDVVPFLLDEIIEIDGESAAYLGKALAKIGKPGVDYFLKKWDQHLDDEAALINLTQTISFYKFDEAVEVIPRILSATQSENFQLAAMALTTLGRLVEKSKPPIDEKLKHTLYEVAFSFLSNTKPLVRKNAARTLGKMLRKEWLTDDQEKKVYNAFLSIAGKDEHHNWDRDFIVRREAEAFIPYFHGASVPTSQYSQSFRILSKRLLCAHTFHYTVEAPLIAKKIAAGQFIIIRPHGTSERIPLSVCGWNRDKGTLNLIIAAVGKTSTEINRMNVGDSFKDMVGPLGERSHLPNTVGTCVVIGGGYGTGAIIPTAYDMKGKGNKVIGVVGARSQDSLIMVDELKEVCDEVILTTNDGSIGKAGLVTDALKEIIAKENINHVLAVGPVPMMKAVSEMTRPLKIETFVSLNAIMVDGTGMCGACRVSVGNETKFACFHGPDFDGHQVDFENLMKRQKMFIKEEKIAFAAMDVLKFNDHDH